MFDALAHAGRLEILRLLIRTGPEGLAAGDIARRMALPPSTLSAHLASLERSGLIAARRQSRFIYYAADMAALRSLVGFLVEDCCGGDPAACAPLIDQLLPTCC